jgi:hypothetical protein
LIFFVQLTGVPFVVGNPWPGEWVAVAGWQCLVAMESLSYSGHFETGIVAFGWVLREIERLL